MTAGEDRFETDERELEDLLLMLLLTLLGRVTGIETSRMGMPGSLWLLLQLLLLGAPEWWLLLGLLLLLLLLLLKEEVDANGCGAKEEVEKDETGATVVPIEVVCTSCGGR